jgi:hypothetical protein
LSAPRPNLQWSDRGASQCGIVTCGRSDPPTSSSERRTLEIWSGCCHGVVLWARPFIPHSSHIREYRSVSTRRPRHFARKGTGSEGHMFIGPERSDAVCGGLFELRPTQHTVLRVASHLLKIQSQSKQIIAFSRLYFAELRTALPHLLTNVGWNTYTNVRRSTSLSHWPATVPRWAG